MGLDLAADAKQLTEIVLTGGPVGGKTTSLAYLAEKLRDRGFRVFTTPEVATTLVTGGLYELGDLPQLDPDAYYASQKEFVLLQRDFRARFQGLARCFDQKCVILHDRAEMDTAAYMQPAEWRALMDELRLGLSDVRDSYDAVIHLVTVARDAPDLYALEQGNNPARQETSVAAACASDEATLEAWVGHPRLRIIDNSTDFHDKLRRTLQAVLRAVGAPVPVEQERKFLLATPPTGHPLLADARVAEIEQTYLISADPRREVRLRRRVEAGQAVYSRTEKVLLPGSQLRQEKEEVLSPSDYLGLLKGRDPSRRTLRKRRYCFVHEFTYCELDIFAADDPLAGLAILEVEQAEGERLDLPPFDITREVTDEAGYYNVRLAEST